MGWSSGSQLAEELWRAVRSSIPTAKRKKIARDFIDYFEGYDCDTIQEAETLCKDAKYQFVPYDPNDEDSDGEWEYL
jgi:hypothetical protein